MFQMGLCRATYPANLCRLLSDGEFAKFGSDFGEAVDQTIEYTQRITTGVGQRAPKHFHDVLRDLECLKGAGQIWLEPDAGCGGSGWRHEMSRLGASGAELALNICLCELGVEDSHFGCRMAQQVHECGEADARPQHLSSKGVAEHVGDYGPGDAERGSHFGQFGAEFAQ